MKKTVTIIALLLVLIGFTGFIGGILISTSVIEFTRELPLGDTEGIVVDKFGRIYVGLGFYGKVQVYDNEGHFLRNWKVESSGGSFRIDLTKEQNILIATARGNRQIVYDSIGNILSKIVIDRIYSRRNKQGDIYITDQKGKYEIIGYVFPKIVRTTLEKKNIVDQGLLLKLMNGPLPAWLFAMMGVGLLLLSHKDKISRKTKK
jgi:hypothetical protein